MSDTRQPTIAEFGNTSDCLTERSRAALAHAEREAHGFNHNYIGTEHLLLGLLAVEDGLAATVLASLGVQADTVRAAIVDHIGRGAAPHADRCRLTPRSEQIIELARNEARKLGHASVGTEHLLLGLVRDGEGVAADILGDLGIDGDKVQAEVARALHRQAKGSVITCRIWSHDLEAIDLLIEAGIRNTRSDAAAWLIHAGIAANAELFERVQSTVADIRRLRQQAQAVAREINLTTMRPPQQAGPSFAADAIDEHS